MSKGEWLTEEDLIEEARLFKEWMAKPRSIFFKQFAVERGYAAQKLAEYAERSEAFKLVYQQAKEWQESKVATESFWGEGNSKIAQLMLNVHHDWIEKTAAPVSTADPLSKHDGQSKDIINDSK